MSTHKAFIDSFNGRFGSQCLDVLRFLSLADVRDKIEIWRPNHNEHRPQSAEKPLASYVGLGYLDHMKGKNCTAMLVQEWRYVRRYHRPA